MQINAFAKHQKQQRRRKTVKSFQFDDSQTGNTTKTTAIRPLFMVKAVLYYCLINFSSHLHEIHGQ